MAKRDQSAHGLTRRGFLIAVGGAGLAACAPAPSSSTSSPAPSAPAATGSGTAITTVPPGSKVVAATVSTSWTVRVVPQVATVKGYWKDQGLAVDIPVVGPGNTHMAAWIGGSIDFSLNINTDNVARANATGEKLYAVAGSSNKINYVLYSAANIKTWDDLKGKTVAIDTPQSSVEYLVRDLVAKHGLTPGTDFQFVTVAGTVTEREQAVTGGAVGAALGTDSDWPTLEPKGLHRLGQLSDVYPDYQQAIMGGRGPVIEQQPAATVAYLKGLVKTFQFIKDSKNDDEIYQILKDTEKLSLAKADFVEQLNIQRPLWPDHGELNLTGVQTVVKREQDAGRIDKSYDWHQLVRTDPLDQALKELGIK